MPIPHLWVPKWLMPSCRIQSFTQCGMLQCRRYGWPYRLPHRADLLFRLTEIKAMSDRLRSVRDKIYDLLANKFKTPGNWIHLKRSVGMYW